MKALSVRLPWAWLIVNDFKRIENRGKQFSYRGPLLIHASKTFDEDYAYKTDVGIEANSALYWLPRKLANQGGYKKIDSILPHISDLEKLSGKIIGLVSLIDSVTESDDPWFVGPVGLVLKNGGPLPPTPYRGMPGLFDVPDEIVLEHFGL